MTKLITVSYPFRGDTFQIELKYAIQTSGDTQTIACSVESKHFPIWLQLRKFEMLSINEKNIYTPLFNEINNGKNLDTILFIDQAYTEIMKAEHLKVRSFAAAI